MIDLNILISLATPGLDSRVPVCLVIQDPSMYATSTSSMAEVIPSTRNQILQNRARSNIVAWQNPSK